MFTKKIMRLGQLPKFRLRTFRVQRHWKPLSFLHTVLLPESGESGARTVTNNVTIKEHIRL